MVKKDEGGGIMKVISIFLALINSLLAGLLIIFLATSTDFKISMAWWSILRILLALFVIAAGVLSWLSMIVTVRPLLLALGSLFLAGIGPATMVWAFHKASLTGHMEYYMLIYGASLFVQGCSLLLGLAEGRETAAA
jgi:ABC-type polysaccharide/polyol phosphate export permease